MASGYILKHPTTASAGSPTAGGPWIYLAVDSVTMPLTNKVIRVDRPDQDQKFRRRANREKKVTLRVNLAGRSGEVGVDSGAGITGGGKLLQEKLEEAWQNWKASGAVRLVLGTDSSGVQRVFDGIVENVTIDWNPAKGEDDADGGAGVRGATVNFLIGSVSA